MFAQTKLFTWHFTSIHYADIRQFTVKSSLLENLLHTSVWRGKHLRAFPNKTKVILTLGILHFLLMCDVCSADSGVSCSEYTWTFHTVTFSGRVSSHSTPRWARTLRSFLPFTGGQKLLAAGHTSSETHSLDGRSARGPPLDAGAKCKKTGKNSNVSLSFCPRRTDAWTPQSQSTYSNLQIPVKFVVSEPHSSNCFTLSSLFPAHVHSLYYYCCCLFLHTRREREREDHIAQQLVRAGMFQPHSSRAELQCAEGCPTAAVCVCVCVCT